MQFNFNSAEPLYLQVAEQIMEAILAKIYLADDQIPSTTEISRSYHINPATVLKGMNLLVNQGLIVKKRGIGMFVTPQAYQKIVEQRRDQFFQQRIIDLIKEARRLQISKAELVSLIERGFNE
ncbi:GntR family transcriptional regulator [Liquorilactobacillus nagelii]|uniref:GntR family transcriptional regulator n=1 Tax=Liquorilactobacillus nagelii TaxID=82688 RepID=UPI001CCDC48C|nr:GntR family transcriptional regulator [Liquorilactobacillus nagelii]ULQ48722.1 GntR family transcriptional regulator [Liquorilactobacillus nagelii]